MKTRTFLRFFSQTSIYWSAFEGKSFWRGREGCLIFSRVCVRNQFRVPEGQLVQPPMPMLYDPYPSQLGLPSLPPGFFNDGNLAPEGFRV